MKNLLFVVALLSVQSVTAAPAIERATYDSAGGLTSLITDGAAFPLHGYFAVNFAGGGRATLQPHDQRTPISREGLALHWMGTPTFANGAQGQFDAAWAESETGVTLNGSVTEGGPAVAGARAFRFPLPVDSVDYVVDLPRSTYEGWTLNSSGLTLPATKPADPTFFRASADRVTLIDPQKNWSLVLLADQAREISISDRWEGEARFYRIRFRLASGVWGPGEVLKFGLTFKLEGQAHASLAHVTVDPGKPRYAFDGFGGDYCFATQTPVADYMLDHLHQAWARLEFKAMLWDGERERPGPALQRDFQLMQRVQKMGLPWILTVWRLPERFYTDPNQKPFGTFARQIAPDRWPEFLDLLGSYLTYLKTNYGAEPDYFSFNESDLGVDIGFTGETFRDMVKRVGADLASRGFKTKMLLGDTANPRDSHKFTLPTAADPEAMKYVGALSVHSWGGGTAAQYNAWGALRDWLQLPLVVAEAGTDPGAYRNHCFDSYAYGLGEMRQYQELLRDLRPSAIIYWEFTEDYGLVHVGADKSIEPTGRFWLMKHFTNLTPLKSEVVATTSDQPDVLVSAFAKGGAFTMHILNTGPARDVVLTGLPAGDWRKVTTTEIEGFQETDAGDVRGKPWRLPARSLTSLVRGQ